jgi:hypothetical protein
VAQHPAPFIVMPIIVTLALMLGVFNFQLSVGVAFEIKFKIHANAKTAVRNS